MNNLDKSIEGLRTLQESYSALVDRVNIPTDYQKFWEGENNLRAVLAKFKDSDRHIYPNRMYSTYGSVVSIEKPQCVFDYAGVVLSNRTVTTADGEQHRIFAVRWIHTPTGAADIANHKNEEVLYSLANYGWGNEDKYNYSIGSTNSRDLFIDPELTKVPSTSWAKRILSFDNVYFATSEDVSSSKNTILTEVKKTLLPKLYYTIEYILVADIYNNELNIVRWSNSGYRSLNNKLYYEWENIFTGDTIYTLVDETFVGADTFDSSGHDTGYAILDIEYKGLVPTDYAKAVELRAVADKVTEIGKMLVDYIKKHP